MPPKCSSSSLVCHSLWRVAVASLARCVVGGLLDAFPHVDDSQLVVYDAEVVQFVGTASASAVSAALRAAGDTRWQPLLVDSGTRDTESRNRVLVSIGVGNFRNTTAGAYRELAIAFPACEAASPMQLSCSSFNACQSRLPDCAHTYMFRSFVSREAALWRVRASGVDARLASQFTFTHENATTEALKAGTTLKFSVLGPGGQEVLEGAIEAAPSLTQHDDSDDEEGATRPAKGRGYSLQPHVGVPGVLGAGGQARYLCGFPGDVDARPARQIGPLYGGGLVQDFGFEPQGAIHMSSISVVQLPPWGFRRSPAKHVDISQAERVSTPTRRPEPDGGLDGGLFSAEALQRALQKHADENGEPDSEEAVATSAAPAPQVPWTHRKQHQSGDDVNATHATNTSTDFPWHLHHEQPLHSPAQDASKHSQQWTPGHKRRAVAEPGDGSGGARFPWNTYEM